MLVWERWKVVIERGLKVGEKTSEKERDIKHGVETYDNMLRQNDLGNRHFHCTNKFPECIDQCERIF